MSDTKKQLPIITSSDKGFWEGARRHELMAYKCLNCGTFYYPVTDCVNCNSPKMKWTKVSGKGSIYTYIIYHMAYHPAWKDDIPYNVCWIKLDEGPLLMSNVIKCKNEDLFIGMPVEVVFDNVTDDITLPKFQPVT